MRRQRRGPIKVEAVGTSVANQALRRHSNLEKPRSVQLGARVPPLASTRKHRFQAHCTFYFPFLKRQNNAMNQWTPGRSCSCTGACALQTTLHTMGEMLFFLFFPSFRLSSAFLSLSLPSTLPLWPICSALTSSIEAQTLPLA